MNSPIRKLAQSAHALLGLQSKSIADARLESPIKDHSPTFTKAVVAQLPDLSKPKVNKAVTEMEAEGYVFQKQQGRTGPYKMSIQNVADIYAHRKIPKYRNKYNKAHVIFLTNLKGGVAKTITCVTLAHSLRVNPTLIKQDLRILVIDLDPQASATMLLNQVVATTGTDCTSAQAMLQNVTKEELVNDFIIDTNLQGVDLMPASIEDGFIASELPNLTKEHLPDQKQYNILQENIINKINDLYDIILIDSGPHLDGFLLNSLVAADTLLVPVTPDAVDFNSTLKFLNRIPSIYNKITSTGVEVDEPLLFTFMVKTKKTYECDRVASELKSICGANFLSSDIPYTAPFIQSGDSCDTIFTVDKTDFSGGRRKTLREATEKALDFARDVFDTITFYRD